MLEANEVQTRTALVRPWLAMRTYFVEASMKGAPRKQNGDGNATKHGLYTMKKALMRLGNRAIDRRTKPGRALTKWRVDLVHDLGGDTSIQQDTIIDLAVKSKLIIDSVDAWVVRSAVACECAKEGVASRRNSTSATGRLIGSLLDPART